MKWFKHDSNASMNAKLKKLILKFGAEGYGVYWFCIESISQQVEPHNLTFELEHDAEIIGHSLGLSDKKVEVIMRYMLELSLFESSNGVITCLKLAKRVDEYTSKLLRNRDNVPTLSRQSPTKSALLEENRIEQKRVEENRKHTVTSKKKKKFVPPTLVTCQEYFKQIGVSDPELTGEKFFNEHEAVGWMRKGQPIASWKGVANQWKIHDKRFKENKKGAFDDCLGG